MFTDAALMSSQDNPGNVLKADPPGVDLQHPKPSSMVNVTSVSVTDSFMPPPTKGPLGKDLSYAPPISYRSVSTLPESTLTHRVPSRLRKISDLKIPPLSLGIVKMSDGKYQKLTQGKRDRKHDPLSSTTVSRPASPTDPIENWSQPSPSPSSGLPVPIPLAVSYPVPLHLPPGPERDEYLKKELAVCNKVMKQMDVDESENPDVFDSFHQRTLDRFAHHLPTPTPPPHADPTPNRNESHSVTPTNKSVPPQMISPTPSRPEDLAINYHNPVARSPSIPLAYEGDSSPIPAVQTVHLATEMMAQDFFIEEMKKVDEGAVSPALPRRFFFLPLQSLSPIPTLLTRRTWRILSLTLPRQSITCLQISTFYSDVTNILLPRTWFCIIRPMPPSSTKKLFSRIESIGLPSKLTLLLSITNRSVNRSPTSKDRLILSSKCSESPVILCPLLCLPLLRFPLRKIYLPNLQKFLTTFLLFLPKSGLLILPLNLLSTLVLFPPPPFPKRPLWCLLLLFLF